MHCPVKTTAVVTKEIYTQKMQEKSIQPKACIVVGMESSYIRHPPTPLKAKGHLSAHEAVDLRISVADCSIRQLSLSFSAVFGVK